MSWVDGAEVDPSLAMPNAGHTLISVINRSTTNYQIPKQEVVGLLNFFFVLIFFYSTFVLHVIFPFLLQTLSYDIIYCMMITGICMSYTYGSIGLMLQLSGIALGLRL